MDGSWLSLVVFVLTVTCLVWLHLGLKKVRFLSAIPDGPCNGDLPSVSVIVSALNEAETIEPPLRSLLTLDYPRLEIIAIDILRLTGWRARLLAWVAADGADHAVHPAAGRAAHVAAPRRQLARHALPAGRAEAGARRTAGLACRPILRFPGACKLQRER